MRSSSVPETFRNNKRDPQHFFLETKSCHHLCVIPFLWFTEIIATGKWAAPETLGNTRYFQKKNSLTYFWALRQKVFKILMVIPPTVHRGFKPDKRAASTLTWFTWFSLRLKIFQTENSHQIAKVMQTSCCIYICVLFDKYTWYHQKELTPTKSAPNSSPAGFMVPEIFVFFCFFCHNIFLQQISGLSCLLRRLFFPHERIIQLVPKF